MMLAEHKDDGADAAYAAEQLVRDAQEIAMEISKRAVATEQTLAGSRNSLREAKDDS